MSWGRWLHFSALSCHWMTGRERRSAFLRSSLTYGLYHYKPMLTIPPPVRLVLLTQCLPSGLREASSLAACCAVTTATRELLENAQSPLPVHSSFLRRRPLILLRNTVTGLAPEPRPFLSSQAAPLPTHSAACYHARSRRNQQAGSLPGAVPMSRPGGPRVQPYIPPGPTAHPRDPPTCRPPVPRAPVTSPGLL